MIEKENVKRKPLLAKESQGEAFLPYKRA